MSEIKFTCPGCRQSLEAPGDMAGEVIACPSCKTNLRVPGQPARASASGAARWKFAVWTASIGFALIVGFLVWFLAIRDTWERDNSGRIRELCEAVAGLNKNGKKNDALAKSKELADFLGPRKMKNAYLAQIVSEANTTGDGIRKEIEKQKNLASLRQIESEATRLANQADWVNASQRYGEALAFIEKNGTGDADFTTAQQRIAQAKQVADQRLADIQKEQARIAAEQKAREEMERQRKDQEMKLARIRATLKGGAWLTKKAGNSEIIRGLKIYVLKGKTSPECAERILAAVVEGADARVKRAMGSESHWAKACKEYPDNEYIRPHLEEARRERESVEQMESARTNLVATYRRTINQTYSDMGRLFNLLPEMRTPGETAVWIAVCAEQLQAEAATGIDGTYETQTAGGDFYLYAIYESEYSTVEWMIPIHVTEVGTQKVDFHNETAAFIRNKKD